MYFLVLLAALLACAAGVPLNTTKPRIDRRIDGGTDTDITSHPYQVSLLLWGSHRCSGSIISEDWVVTLAFCVDEYIPKDFIVMSGSTYSSSGGTIHRVTDIIVHERYTILDWDVALVQVSPAFTFSDSVQPITLECNPLPVGTYVVLTGWERTSEVDPYSTTLLEVTVQVITDSECNSTYADYGGITDRMICAGDTNGGKGACWVDWGGPLVANNRLVGIYNYGWGCGDPSYPDVYTKISAVCDWIVTINGP